MRISTLCLAHELPCVELGRKQRESQLHRHFILQTGGRTVYGRFCSKHVSIIRLRGFTSATVLRKEMKQNMTEVFDSTHGLTTTRKTRDIKITVDTAL